MLTGKTIFITGATSGFGLACARLFIKNGAHVVATGRREERLAELKKELGENLHTLTLDVRDQKAVEAAVKNLPAAFANVDILINNAGLALGLASFEELPLDQIQQMIGTNISGVMYCTHALLPQMVSRGGGHIVNLGSIAGTYPYPGGNVYGATKAFLAQFSLNLRSDLNGKNVRVTNIEPGMCETEFSVVRFEGDKNKADNVYAGMTPLSADDIANTIFWCITQPAHVNINRVEIMPTQQAFSPFAVSRK
ncbi:MAG: SDR family oxidoreductase [Alphaproteobacteria bacterium]|nr:SDR family oxidoreductase [Alphaproteobacteria bacterium]